MDWLIPSIIASLSGSLVLLAAYLFLYLTEKERCLGVWTASWFVYTLRMGAMLGWSVMGQPGWLLAANQLCTLWSSLLLIWGAFLFSGLTLSRWWTFAVLAGSVWIIAGIPAGMSMTWLSLPTFTIVALAYIWTGVLLLRAKGISGYGRHLAGWSFIVWGLHKADYPFLRPLAWAAPWGYMVGSFLAVLAAVSVLLVYFEKAREKQSVSERRFRQLAENIREVFWVVSPDWKEIIYVSPAYEEVWGLSTESLYKAPESWINSLLEEDRKDVLEYLTEKTAGSLEGIVFPDYRVRRPDGSVRWISARGFPVFDDSGQVYRVVGIAEDITDRKASDEALRRSEENFRLIVENQNDLVVKFDRDYRLLFASPSYLGFFNRKEEDILNRQFLSLVHQDELPGLLAAIEKLKRPPHTSRHEERVLTGRGWRWLSWSNKAVLDEAGAPVEFVAVGRDVTERKEMVAALQESEARHRTLTENSPDIIARFSRDYEILYISPAVFTLLNLSPQSLEGKTLLEIGIPEKHRLPLEEGLAWVFSNGAPLEKECQYEGPMGAVVFDWRVFPEWDQDGQVQSVLSVSRDVTKNRHSEQAYQQLFSSMVDGFALHEIIVDDRGEPSDYRFLAVNPAFERQTGLKAQDIVGRTVLEVLPGVERHWVELYGRVALTGEPVSFNSYARELDKHFEVNAYQTTPGQFACIFVDVTDKHRAEMEKAKLEGQLAQARKMEAVGTLAGGIAHDFNNILSAILGYAELAEWDGLEQGHDLTNISQIIKGAQRARDLVHQILAFSRIAQPDKKPLDLGRLVKETLLFIRASVPTTVEIDSSVDAGQGTVLVDQTQIQQVLINLCTNAAQSMKESGGLLTVNLDRVVLTEEGGGGPDGLAPGAYLRLSVGDTGPGITAEVMERIFDPFFTTKPVGEGTGMGLAVVHGIVKNHGGTIKVFSEPGRGATFEVFLPLYGDECVRHEDQPDAPLPTGFEKVLFVDDERALVELGRLMLSRLGYEVAARTDAGEALKLLESEPDRFDMLITDQTMPRLTGMDLAREAWRVRPGLPVLLCTGYSDSVSPETALEKGFAAFLYKPLELRELARTVREVLDRKE